MLVMEKGEGVDLDRWDLVFYDDRNNREAHDE